MANSIDIDIGEQISEHLKKREELVAKEKELRHDHEFRKSLSPTAKHAAAIVSRIRQHEAETVWTKETEEEEGDIYPGMMFTLAKERMERTELWRIVKRMPKGCLLHAHLEAMVDMDWLFDVALNTPGIHIYSDIPLTTSKALEKANIQFTYSTTSPKAIAGLYSSKYEPGSLILVTEVADSFPANLLLNEDSGNKTSREGFREWIISRITITAEESLKHHEGINMVWAKFQSIFMVIQGIIHYEPIYRQFVRHILHHLHQDGILWVDLRATFLMTFKAANTGTILPRADVIKVFSEVIEDYKSSPEGRGFWGARMIWTSIRRFDQDTIIASMKECVEAKKLYPNVIAGFDLVGQEDLGRTHLEMLPEILWFKEYCKQEGVDIPFFFHAGETLGDGNGTDGNLFDAILLGTKRIGHGFSLHKHPHLISLVKENNICVEVCPISNEILRLTSSILSHSLPAMLAHGIPVSLNNDDPGILGQKTTASITHDYWQVLQAFDNVGLEGLGDLALTGVKFAAFEGGEVGVMEGPRVQRVEEWCARWEAFCEWVVAEFGHWEGK
ncbi:Metallo-dependent hydrolase [Choiromyces venosus 120613-1]|uniref:adenosine deaminase n=1 Tax=Choiromyces venosus 120613-1 TaxID=1336337 RepID=A0A3N4J7Q0_9PEZI|nr:Metallo-dependent hydrolase [Choiromyces venosus 120613-1]